MTHYARGSPAHITGPVHGIITACERISATIQCTDSKITITTPLGAVLDLDSEFDTHFQACIREACRHRLLSDLIKRNCKDGTPQRQDMVGIEAYVDLGATMALLNSNKNPKSDEDPDGNKLGSPCRLQPADRRRVQTIMAGSIRAPHRLKHAGKTDSDICTHPECKGARADTTHIFWKCVRFKSQRKPYEDAINQKLNWLKKNDKGNYKHCNKNSRHAVFSTMRDLQWGA